MEDVRYSLLMREYWNDFRGIRKYISPAVFLLFPLPYWVNILTGHDASLSITMLMLLPGILFLCFSVSTHMELLPDMFYLLPLSRTQRERYIRRCMAVRIITPGVVWIGWFGLICCFRPVGTVGMLIGCAGSVLGCAVIHLTQAVEHTHSYESTLDSIAATLLITFPFFALIATDVVQIIWAVICFLYGVHSWRMYRKLCAGCIRPCDYEAKASEGQKK